MKNRQSKLLDILLYQNREQSIDIVKTSVVMGKYLGTNVLPHQHDRNVLLRNISIGNGRVHYSTKNPCVYTMSTQKSFL